jgi:hypothetical protein
MKPKLNMVRIILPLALFVVICLTLSATPSYSQDSSSWFSSGTWWDWSDYRATMRYRYFAPRLVSGYLKRPDRSSGQLHEYDLLATGNTDDPNKGGLNFDPQPEPFNSFMFQLQVDRLGLRLTVDEDLIFRGSFFDPNSSRLFSGFSNPSTGFVRISELDLSSSRAGLSLDIVRYPFLRAGIDFEYSFSGVTFLVNRGYGSLAYKLIDPSKPDTPDNRVYINSKDGQPKDYFRSTSGPASLGLHLFAIPARVREVPLTVQGKILFAFPYWNKIWGIEHESRMFEWEVAVGARPAVWDASAFGLSTFSLGIEAGFRSVTLDAEFNDSVSTHALWQGPFFQIALYY